MRRRQPDARAPSTIWDARVAALPPLRPSGGRADSATYDDYSADLRMVVAYLGKRKDVDPKRVALMGYGEGGWIALSTAGAAVKNHSTSFSVQNPITRSTPARLYQLRSKITTSPAAGKCGT